MTRRPSSHTLLGRAHERVRLEAARDAHGLFELLDPAMRGHSQPACEDGSEAEIAGLQAWVDSIESAEIVDIEILEARKVSEEHGGRAAATVRSRVRYNGDPAATERRTVWVRDRGVWYATSLDPEHG